MNVDIFFFYRAFNAVGFRLQILPSLLWTLASVVVFSRILAAVLFAYALCMCHPGVGLPPGQGCPLVVNIFAVLFSIYSLRYSFEVSFRVHTQLSRAAFPSSSFSEIVLVLFGSPSFPFWLLLPESWSSYYPTLPALRMPPAGSTERAEKPWRSWATPPPSFSILSTQDYWCNHYYEIAWVQKYRGKWEKKRNMGTSPGVSIAPWYPFFVLWIALSPGQKISGKKWEAHHHLSELGFLSSPIFFPVYTCQSPHNSCSLRWVQILSLHSVIETEWSMLSVIVCSTLWYFVYFCLKKNFFFKQYIFIIETLENKDKLGK